MSPPNEIILLASLTAMACTLPGVFLVLRRVALMSDAISHAILLGIVVAFFFTKSLSSPWLIVGAALVGILTVSLTEGIIQTRKLKKDAAIGLVFPFLFSLGVILLNRYARDVHLDSDCILFGEIAFAPFNRMIVEGRDWGPIGLWVMGGIFLMNLSLLLLFYKELKISTFDPETAAVLGLSPVAIHYGLMTVVSLTAVGAFEHVGSILVVALMITPPATAYLLTERLSRMILLSLCAGFLSAWGGYRLAHAWDANIAGSMAAASGFLFVLALIFSPKRGLLAQTIRSRFRRWDLPSDTLLIHLLQAEWQGAGRTERVVSHMNAHMGWSEEWTRDVIRECLDKGFLFREGDLLCLTDLGREQAKTALQH